MSRIIRTWMSAVAGALLVTALAVPAMAYDGEVAGQVIVSGLQPVVDCPTSDTVTATVLDTEGAPIAEAMVSWSFDASQSGDSISPAQSQTDAQGEATAQLDLAPTPGMRVVRATYGDQSATATVRCQAEALPDTGTAPGGGVPLLAFGALAAVLAVLAAGALRVRRRPSI